MARYGEDRYYQRIGQSFLVMEHFQIADMFGRRARPLLEVELVPDQQAPHQVRLWVRNLGRGAARAPFIEFTVDPPFQRNPYGVDGNRNEMLALSLSAKTGWWMHSGGADFVIHPMMAVVVGGVWLGHSPGAIQPLPTKCTIHYRAGALDVAPLEGTMAVSLPY